MPRLLAQRMRLISSLGIMLITAVLRLTKGGQYSVNCSRPPTQRQYSTDSGDGKPYD
jgi:hypothetical protein